MKMTRALFRRCAAVALVGMGLFGWMNPAQAQQYSGMSGLIHTPSADMDPAGEARIGGHFLNKEFIPEAMKGSKGGYHTASYYISITPFSWIEIAYTCTLMKGGRVNHGVPVPADVGYYHKDRYFSAKLQPIRESVGKWWPSVAVGLIDPATELNSSHVQVGTNKGDKVIGSRYSANWYVAASKHFQWNENRLGVHVAYRDWHRVENRIYNGVVGGLTFQPGFDRNLRFIAEYTGDDVNVGFDWKLWKHLLLQSSLQNGKYFSGGVCFCINLL